MISGHASAAGTARFRSRFPALADAGHFRRHEHVRHLADLWLSSIGIGTYLGEPDPATDSRYATAVLQAITSGVNVLDSAINYRLQRSERSIGAALAQAIESRRVQRDELLICTKAGYLTYDGTVPADPRRYFLEQYIDTGIIPREEFVGGMHCMAPSFLHDQIQRSRQNLQMDTIDVFYLHNPEQQLGEISQEAFYDRLRRAFTALENEVAVGNIRMYGTATWNGYRSDTSSRDYLDLQQLAAIAREAAGDEHHFRVVQLPFNLGMPEAFAKENQNIQSRKTSLLAAASELGIAVVGSATLLQGRLAGRLPEFVRDHMHCDTDSGAAIQFARSSPGVATALVGMSRAEHVEANLKVVSMPLAGKADWERLFQQQ
ncbi:MAG TPA: aldo/keto reductase [Terriglobales bacterium]|nr:aldo/keto reductase [Terriglobales bacterium]